MFFIEKLLKYFGKIDLMSSKLENKNFCFLLSFDLCFFFPNLFSLFGVLILFHITCIFAFLIFKFSKESKT